MMLLTLILTVAFAALGMLQKFAWHTFPFGWILAIVGLALVFYQQYFSPERRK